MKSPRFKIREFVKRDECDLGGSEFMGCLGGVVIMGETDFTVSNFSVSGAQFGVVADDTKNVVVRDAKLQNCRVPLTAHGSKDFAVLNIEINGWKLSDFTGDFEFLAVLSAEDILHLGEMLRTSDVKDHLEILRSNKLYDFLDSKGAKRGATAAALIGFLISLATAGQ